MFKILYDPIDPGIKLKALENSMNDDWKRFWYLYQNTNSVLFSFQLKINTKDLPWKQKNSIVCVVTTAFSWNNIYLLAVKPVKNGVTLYKHFIMLECLISVFHHPSPPLLARHPSPARHYSSAAHHRSLAPLPRHRSFGALPLSSIINNSSCLTHRVCVLCQ